jgi:hypothetical protein
MMPLLIGLAVVIVLVVIAGFAAGPMMKRSEAAAADRARELVGGPEGVRRLEPRSVGFGTDPEEAGGLKGMGVLAVSDTDLAFVTWRPLAEFHVARADVTAVEAATANVVDSRKGMVEVHYTEAGEMPAKASFRVPDPAEWLDVLGYDWGPEGRPAPTSGD